MHASSVLEQRSRGVALLARHRGREGGSEERASVLAVITGQLCAAESPEPRLCPAQSQREGGQKAPARSRHFLN